MTERSDFERTPPNDLGAEQIVLGAMMDPGRDRRAPGAVADVAEIITAGDYYRAAHQIVHETIMRLYETSEPTDPVAVSAALMRNGELGKVGGAPYLHTLQASVPTAANGGYYARIVRERAIQRRVIEAGTRIVQLGYSGDAESDEIVDRAQAEVYRLADTSGLGGDVQDFRELMDDVLVGLEHEPPGRLSTPWTDLDFLLRIASGSMTIIAARPAVGKSVVGLQIGLHAALNTGQPAVVCSLEMSRQELMIRALSSAARIPMNHLTRRELTDDDWTRLSQARALLADVPLIIDDQPGQSLASIRARMRKVARIKDPAVLVVDYIQMLETPGRVESREKEVAAFSRGLKLIGREFDIPVIAVAQLNRGSEHRMDKRPALSDLRESGSLEQDADNVILLHREDAYDRESPRAGEIDLIVAKQRNGPTGTVTLAFQGHYSRAANMARIDDPAWTPSSIVA